MERNKEEATRAMKIAERKITEKDYNGAKKFLSKAHKLYPNLDGLLQVLTMIDVYVSASNQNNESDWYGILGVDPLADDVTVKKQYKKLALLLHPDKNKFEGAKKAFELVSDAWCRLSDHSKRKSYDQQRKYKEEKQKRDASCFSSETTKDANQTQTKKEAERRFKNPVKRANENSTEEAERLFKRPVFTTGNANSTSEAERLFKNPMKAADANSTAEPERLFGKPWTIFF